MLEEAKDIEPVQQFSRAEAVDLRDKLSDLFWAAVLNQEYTDAVNHAISFINLNMPEEKLK